MFFFLLQLTFCSRCDIVYIIDNIYPQYMQMEGFMFNKTFLEVLIHEGVVSVTSWSNENVHVANTWNRYLRLTADDRILIPAAWFNKTQKNIDLQNKVIVTFGSHEVQGKVGMGTGFVVDGTAKFLTEGSDFDMMKESFPFLTRVLEITPEKVRQTI